MRDAPFLNHVGRRSTLFVDAGQDVDRGRCSCARRHKGLTPRPDAWSKAGVEALASLHLIVCSVGDDMTRTLRSLILVALAFSLAACAPPPPPPSADIVAPAKKKLDAKTQLETGKTY